MRTLLNILVCLSCMLTVPVWGQETDPNPVKSGPDAAPKLPADAHFYATVHVKDVVAMPDLKMVPWEIISAAGKDQWGFDPLVVQRVDLIASLSDDPLSARLKYAFVLHTQKLIEPDLEKIGQAMGQSDLSFVQLNDRFTLIGDLEYIKHLVNDPAGNDGELKKQVARIGDSAIAWFVLVTQPIRKHIDEMCESAPAEIKSDFEVLAKKTQMLAARFDLKTSSIPLVLETANEADAIAAEKAIANLKQTMNQEILKNTQMVSSQLPERVGAALTQFSNRFLGEFKRVSVINRSGARLSTRLTQESYDVSQMGMNLGNLFSLLPMIDDNFPR